ncbi:MAG: ABC transporter permease [Chitinophagales bacterium]
MVKYILKKIFAGIFVLLGVIVLVFFLFQLIRFNPAYSAAGEQASEQTVKNITKEFGLDQTLGKQLLRYLNDLSPLSFHATKDSTNIFFLDDKKYTYAKLLGVTNTVVVVKYPYLGRSFQTNRSVVDLLQERIPNTLVLAFSAMLFATFLGILLGVIASVKPNSLTDNICTAGSVLGISLPSFFAAIVLQLIFAYMLASVTGLHLTGDLFVTDAYTGEEYFSFRNLILPAIALGIRPVAVITQITRSSMLEVIHADYVRTAYAKGLDKNTILFKHSLRNALIPVITSVTGWLASLLAGAFFIEVIFQYNGLGLETINAIKTKDIPVTMGAMIFTATIFVLISIITDILYRVVDPRIRT